MHDFDVIVIGAPLSEVPRTSTYTSVIQPFPSFSEAFLATLSDLEARTAGDSPTQED